MNKRKFAWAAIFVALIIGIAGVCGSIFGFSEVKMSQAELQQRIDAKLPHTNRNGVTVSDVQLGFQLRRLTDQSVVLFV